MSWETWQGEDRTYIGGEERAVGILVDWQHKGGKSFGWIAPIAGIPADLPEAVYHGGDVYVHWKDIQDPRPGAVVTFRLFSDSQGLGAEACESRKVARLVVPRTEAKALKLPSVEGNPVAKYLTSSVFYPELEARGVTLRRYIWDSPLQVYELWGEAEAVVAVAEQVGFCGNTSVEALVSPSMAAQEAAGDVREVPASELANVPPRFRVALKLGSAEDAKQRLLRILGMA
eukprot:TRINITY_DN102172_c0_g1_i1.p1 TRINITY_DN102172_c0_g1~~TRINITY_DN102172_c0_g1_i1.p1  ORF type:complete len:230 (-),score=58.82 TRINITY_DN102172_c0_g1_i1:71-760(-)